MIVGATITRSYGSGRTGVIVAAAGGMPMALVSGLYVVPHGVHAANYLLACVFLLLVSLASIMVIGTGVTVFVAGATAGLLGALTFVAGGLLNTAPAGIAGVTAAIALAALSVLPRLTIWMAKLPLPHVPGNAEDLKEDSGFPDYTEIERRAGRAHEFMTGMIIGCGVTAAVSAVVAASDPQIWGVIEGAAIAVVLMLRGRTYANGSQAVALLCTGILTGGGPADRLAGRGDTGQPAADGVRRAGGAGHRGPGDRHRRPGPAVLPGDAAFRRHHRDAADRVGAAARAGRPQPLHDLPAPAHRLSRRMEKGLLMSRLTSRKRGVPYRLAATSAAVALVLIGPAAWPAYADGSNPAGDPPASPSNWAAAAGRTRRWRRRCRPRVARRTGTTALGQNGSACLTSGVTKPLIATPAAQTMLNIADAQKISTGKGVTVAVIDTGVNKHPMFGNRLENGGDYIERGGNGATGLRRPRHDRRRHHRRRHQGHPYNFIGVAPDAKILAIRQTDSNYTDSEQATTQTAGDLTTLGEAIMYAASQQDVKVITMSVDNCNPVAGGVARDEEISQDRPRTSRPRSTSRST